jgi:hypothetical protein
LRARSAAGTLVKGVFVLDAAGGEPRLLAGGQETPGVPYTRDEAYDPTFSPDGRQIAFGRHISHGAFQPRWIGVSVMNVDGTSVRNVVGGIQPHPDWPPLEFHNLTWARRGH